MTLLILKVVGNIVLIGIELILALIIGLFIYIIFASRISPPKVPNINIGERQQVGPNHYVLGNNWLKKNDHGLWEMYIEGDPYERGVVYGKLAKDLCQTQEEIFVEQIDRFVPNTFFKQMLRLLLGFFNKGLPANIQLENQQEIYGISQSFSDEFDYIAPKYARILNYHAAHDIGHALNDYSIVGCTSFSLKGEATADGKLLTGRNFDFYVGDEFAEDKMILFVNPTDGHAFVSYTWAGFTGVASGLNVEGLSITINAAKSDLPRSTKTPISLLAREILQYCSTIDEAIAIAEKRKVFVSETLMINSKKDNRAVLIEKSPKKMGVYEVDGDKLVCANHYQSETYVNDEQNIENIKHSDSRFRHERVEELLADASGFTPVDAARVLRDQNGSESAELGVGNPRAINQLIGHHSVVIQPHDLKFYVSTHDFQLGEFIAYDVEQAFRDKKPEIVDTIAEDPFINSKTYADFKHYWKTRMAINEFAEFGEPLTLSESEIEVYIQSNPELYITYEMLGRYFAAKKQYKKAVEYFDICLSKNLASDEVRDELKELRDKYAKK